MSRPYNSKRKQSSKGQSRALDLESRAAQAATASGPSGFALAASSPWEQEQHDGGGYQDTGKGVAAATEVSQGLYGSRRRASEGTSILGQARLFPPTPSTRAAAAGGATGAASSVGRSTGAASSVGRSAFTAAGAASSVDRSKRSRFSRGTRISNATTGHSYSAAVHIVCAISENLARETCVASLDAGSPTALQVTKQGNGQMYAETLAYLEVLRPHEVLLNEGRRNSPLTRKVLELFGQEENHFASMTIPVVETKTRPKRRSKQEASRRAFFGGQESTTVDASHAQGKRRSRHTGGDGMTELSGACETSTVIKFVSRSYFDQTRGAELLRRIAREETYDASVVEEYILLSSAHALLKYTQHCLGAHFATGCLFLSINAGGNHRMAIDRSSLLQLELLVNSKTGKVKDSLIGSIDRTRTTVGSRFLRTNLMSPPTRIDTINTRLELVQTIIGNEEFYLDVMEHLERLPDVDKMLSNIALVPRSPPEPSSKRGYASAYSRLASKGITALMGIKSTLTALPAFVTVLQNQLPTTEGNIAQQPSGGSTVQRHALDETRTVRTERSSLLIGLGGGPESHAALERDHLLRAIIATMSQPELAEVEQIVSDAFTTTVEYNRGADYMRHQECFALKCDDTDMISVIRQTFLSNVDEIYSLADSYSEKHGFTVGVKFSTSRGYVLSVPSGAYKNLPCEFLQPTVAGRYIHCTTEEVTSLNARARENVADLRRMTYHRIQNVLNMARQRYDALASLCDAVAVFDMCFSFADTVASTGKTWCKPLLHDSHPFEDRHISVASESSESQGMMSIQSGRFGISVSASGGDGPEDFVPNNTQSGKGKTFTLVTGINGSGKSTHLKQIAILTILAHCGSYVPAEQATFPLRDRICTRIGSADDEENNVSTFMMEMKETSFICNHATEKSLILIDELGRATSNEDGVAIAWSVAEYLLKKRSLVFFVTHYPQLCRLADIYPAVQNVHLEADIVGNGDEGVINYTHKVKDGECSTATIYGVEMAASCGWPREVVEDARLIEGDVAALLPTEGLCQQDPAGDNRSKAYDTLTALWRKLNNAIQHQIGQSFQSLRSQLHKLQLDQAPQMSGVLQAEMDQLIKPSKSPLNETGDQQTAANGPGYTRDGGTDGQQYRDDASSLSASSSSDSDLSSDSDSDSISSSSSSSSSLSLEED